VQVMDECVEQYESDHEYDRANDVELYEAHDSRTFYSQSHGTSSQGIRS
jgi:hypothetical protein